MPDHPPPGRATTVAPLEVDGVRTAVVGTGLWLGGLVVLVVMRDRLGDEGHPVVGAISLKADETAKAKALARAIADELAT